MKKFVLLQPIALDKMLLSFNGKSISSSESWILVRDITTLEFTWVIKAMCGFNNVVVSIPAGLDDVSEKALKTAAKVYEASALMQFSPVELEFPIAIGGGSHHILILDGTRKQKLQKWG